MDRRSFMVSVGSVAFGAGAACVAYVGGRHFLNHYADHGLWPLTEHPNGYPGGRPLKTIDRLVVNTTNDVRYVAHLPEYEGMKQLRELVRTSEAEEAWAYVHPDKWVEVGSGEFRDKDRPGVMVDGQFMHYLFRQHDVIREYHIHPTTADIKKLEESVRVKGIKEEGIGMVKGVFYLYRAIPSWEDIESMINYSTRFHQIKPQGGVSLRIISELGMTDYRLNRKGLQHFRGKSPEYVRQYAQDFHAKVNPLVTKEVEESITLPLDEWKRLQAERIKKILRGVSDDNVVITFAPFDKF